MSQDTIEQYDLETNSFKYLRNNNLAYVDKTDYVYKLVKSHIRTFFLSRPRGFGKSLFLSTLEAYFKGEKELFKGTDIYDLEQKWEPYPILHFDFSELTSSSSLELEKYLERKLMDVAKSYGVRLYLEMGIEGTFEFLIDDIVQKTKKKVVILIDEYDKGIVDVSDTPNLQEMNQNVLRSFFAAIKVQHENIRFCFITGVTHYALNTLLIWLNIHDLSMHNDYAAVCGITMYELLANFSDGIRELAEAEDLSFEEAVDHLKVKYGGYRFTDKDTLVFNPYDIFNCLKYRKFDNYWLKLGIPKVLATQFPKLKDLDLTELTKIWVKGYMLERAYSEENPTPLLFQTGYLTIKDTKGELYRLDTPNGEAREAFS